MPPPRGDLLTALRRTPVSAWHGDVTDWAAALTYYAVLALIPMLLVTVSLTGLADASGTGALIERADALLEEAAGRMPLPATAGPLPGPSQETDPPRDGGVTLVA
ncbi:YhjD/YihY/BrkB family envelope integrity protein [Streptomyces marianii]|uniref:YhjD/YihY/BrkB family envelope integrity protein n=1 Tax=Streptomyces marianii TaxID=1817406 RepID=UPI003899C789